jgi:hypothetical protein
VGHARSALHHRCLFFVAFILGRLFEVDVVAESRGVLVPEGYVKPVQAVAGGSVQNVFVREGERVDLARQLFNWMPERCAAGLANCVKS